MEGYLACARPECGRLFESDQPRRLYCSDKCRKKAEWQRRKPTPAHPGLASEAGIHKL